MKSKYINNISNSHENIQSNDTETEVKCNGQQQKEIDNSIKNDNNSINNDSISNKNDKESDTEKDVPSSEGSTSAGMTIYSLHVNIKIYWYRLEYIYSNLKLK